MLQPGNNSAKFYNCRHTWLAYSPWICTYAKNYLEQPKIAHNKALGNTLAGFAINIIYNILLQKRKQYSYNQYKTVCSFTPSRMAALQHALIKQRTAKKACCFLVAGISTWENGSLPVSCPARPYASFVNRAKNKNTSKKSLYLAYYG